MKLVISVSPFGLMGWIDFPVVFVFVWLAVKSFAI